MRLYVGNVPRLADEQALGAWFARAGFTVQAVELVRGRPSSVAQGHGFVIIEDADSAHRALRRLNGRAFWGRAIVLRPGE